jgi:signal transduction histidine kinase
LVTARSTLAALVENLLDVSKIEHNTLVIEVKKEDWTSIVRSVVREFDQIALQKKIKLNFEEPSYTISPAAVDKFRIAEVLSNLTANAINYTEAGGSVTVSIVEKDGRIETSVKDTGVGIPERSITHLFTKFYRVSGSLEQGSKGTGLGLYISKSIVNKHKGEIWVESKEGVGSTFTFTVPVYKDEDFVTNKF